MDVQVALVAAKAELAAEVQAHVADIVLAVKGAVPGGFEAVRVQGTERVAGEQGAGGVQVERAVGAVVHPAVRGHALVAPVNNAPAPSEYQLSKKKHSCLTGIGSASSPLLNSS